MFLHHLAKHLGADQPGLRMLDLCAAPGGKSTLLASLLNSDSLLISNEVIRSRAGILEENMVRWGYTNTWVSCNDPRDFTALSGYFDMMVIDAPCSGSGLFRKDPLALNEWSEANVELCCQRQQRIIADVWPALKQGGIIIYATCSYSRAEDEDIIDWLTDDFSAESLEVPVPEDWGIVLTKTSKGNTGYRFFPHLLEGEGFFIAAIRKTEPAASLRATKSKSAHDPKMAIRVAPLLEPRDYAILKGREGYHALYKEHEADHNLLSTRLYFRKTGLALGSPAAKEWIPSHDLALSLDRSGKIPSVDIGRDQALKFLKKEDFDLPEAPKGWVLLRHEGLSLGWIKSLGSRFNNYLPKHWRIRMELPSE